MAAAHVVLVIDFCAIQILVDLALKPAKQFWEMRLQAKWQFQVRQLLRLTCYEALTGDD